MNHALLCEILWDLNHNIMKRKKQLVFKYYGHMVATRWVDACGWLGHG
jgi:hypothetical protein